MHVPRQATADRWSARIQARRWTEVQRRATATIAPGNSSTETRPTGPWPLFPVVLALLLVLLTGPMAPGTGTAVLAAQPATPAAAVEPGPDPALVKAVDFLLSRQDESGAFLGVNGEPAPSLTTDAVFALAAAGQVGVETEAAIDQAVAYLETDGLAYVEGGPGPAAKVALAAIAGARDPRAFGGVDLIAALTDPALGTPLATPTGAAMLYGDSVFSHALVLLALAAANEPVPPAAIAVLRQTQLEDGSWGYAGATDAGTGDSNTTALVIQALVATGHGADLMVESALAYLRSVQTLLGQFLYQAREPEMADANSTALAVQALIAAGEDPSSAAWANAERGLLAFQNVSGGFRYIDAEPADNLLATVQAVPALAGYALPVATACPEPASPAAIDATPAIVEQPAPGRGQAPCVPLEPAA